MRSLHMSAAAIATAAIASSLALCFASATYADEVPVAGEALVRQLMQRLEEQEKRIDELERRLAARQDGAMTAIPAAQPLPASPATPERKGGSGFSLQSAKGDSHVRIRGLLHVDNRAFLDDSAPAGADTFLLRRVRPSLEGTLGDIYDFKFAPDFAGGKTVIQDAYVTARFKPSLVLTVGKFKTPFGLERLQSSSDMRFVERGLPNNLVPNRDIGLQVGGDLLGGTLNYALAYMNGVNDGSSSDSNSSADVDNNDDKDLALRLFAQPFRKSGTPALRGLGFGVAATWVDSTGTTSRTLLPSYKSPGQQNIFGYRTGSTASFADGERLRLAYQGYYHRGSFGLLGEYVTVRQDVTRVLSPTQSRHGQLDHAAWQLSGGYFLTGEDSGFKAPAPARAFGKDGGRGAVELVARVGELDLDDAAFVGGANSFADPATAVSKAFAWSVGVNWYLTPVIRLVVDYEQTNFDGGSAEGADRPDEQVVLSRVQFAF